MQSRLKEAAAISIENPILADAAAIENDYFLSQNRCPIMNLIPFPEAIRKHMYIFTSECKKAVGKNSRTKGSHVALGDFVQE